MDCTSVRVRLYSYYRRLSDSSRLGLVLSLLPIVRKILDVYPKAVVSCDTVDFCSFLTCHFKRTVDGISPPHGKRGSRCQLSLVRGVKLRFLPRFSIYFLFKQITPKFPT